MQISQVRVQRRLYATFGARIGDSDYAAILLPDMTIPTGAAIQDKALP